MSREALTLMIYAIGFGTAGLGLMLVPNLILPLFGFAPTQEVWIHLIGLLMISLASYDVLAAQREIGPIIQASVPGRLFAGAIMVGTFLLDLVGAGILFFAAVDILGALATMRALRSSTPLRA